jgi:hypothetical protein
MFKNKTDADWRAIPLALSLCALICASPAFGQDAKDGAKDGDASAKQADAKRPKVSNSKPTSPNATINLVNMLVKQGILKQEQADLLIKQAEDEAYVARQAAKDASVKADDATKAATAAAAAAQPPGTRHVTYVPEIVKQQLRDEIKQQVMAKAVQENWASPNAYPEWARRIRFYGDMRVRYEGLFYPKGNDQGDAVNFNAINTGSPYDVSTLNQSAPPTYDASQDRNFFRLRARLGMEADLLNGFTAGIRIATGDDSQPVSTNQTLGNNGGNFSKYELWLDRGYLNYSAWNQDLSVSAGRFSNPFFSPTDLVWYNDLGFDGFAVQAKHEVAPGYTPFAVIGAFPIFNTAFNASVNLDTTGASTVTELPSNNKWLYGGQLGFDARFNSDISWRVGVAFYDFDHVQGQMSTCYVTSASDVCPTDYTRPSFAQKGNTYIPLRNIIGTVANDNGVGPGLYEYFGLASEYRPVVVSSQLDLAQFNPVHIIIDGEYVINTAFNRAFMNSLAAQGLIVNNLGPSPGNNQAGPYNGGNQGWTARVTVGDKEIKHLWDWNVHAGYKYIESDATVDAFVDPDFGFGGTNLKGYFVGANLGLGENVWGTVRWLSANNIGGVPYAVDVLLVDVNAKF